jgi:DNA-binding MarR family transcriptional regulator
MVADLSPPQHRPTRMTLASPLVPCAASGASRSTVAQHQPTFAFKVTIEAGDQHHEHVVAGTGLAEAAVAAQERMPLGRRVVRMVELGELLAAADGVVVELASPIAAAPVAVMSEPQIHEDGPAAVQHQGGAPRGGKAPVARQGSGDAASASQPIPRQGTRRDQLLAVLRQHGGPLHLDVVAAALEIKRGHANQVAREAIKTGLGERVGSRTGKIKLVEAIPPTRAGVAPEAEPPPAPAPVTTKSRRSGPTRIDRLVELLRGRTEPVHLDEISAALGMTRGNADSAVRIAARAGLVRRVGSRTGLVELVNALVAAAPAAEPVPNASAAPTARTKKRSAAPTRVDRLVAFLESRKGAAHATEIAEALATTRGNADSAVRAGVRAGLVRRAGSRTGLVELVAPADAAAPVSEDRAPVVEPAEAPVEPDPQGTRVEQLVALLQGRCDPVHVRDIRVALSIKPANVHNIVGAAVKAGLVRRVGSRTGLVELAAAESTPAGPGTPAGVEAAAEL